MSKIHTQQQGFTILELLVSTAVFATVLLLCSMAIIQVGRMYYKGIIANRTQNAARSVVEDASQAVQFGSMSGSNFYRSGPPTTYSGITVKSYCVGEVRYSYAPNTVALGTSSGRIPHVLWKDKPGVNAVCTPLNLTIANPGGVSGQEMLGDAMRVVQFVLTQDTSNLYSIKLTVAYGGSNDVFDNTSGSPNYNICASSSMGGQYCSVSIINTSAAKRL